MHMYMYRVYTYTIHMLKGTSSESPEKSGPNWGSNPGPSDCLSDTLGLWWQSSAGFILTMSSHPVNDLHMPCMINMRYSNLPYVQCTCTCILFEGTKAAK